jgi:dTDP-4-dehydrorhamnose 3,5-epimerase
VIFAPTPLEGAYRVELERNEDVRGFFARTWCCEEWEAHNLNSRLSQCNISFNVRKGTLRGMHYQKAPWEEAKLVRCTMGSIFAVAIDLRGKSPTFKKHFHEILSSVNRRSLYIPEGMAFGFQTLMDNTEIFYQTSQRYMSEFSRGVRWNDPAFGITWPDDERIILDRDRNYPDFHSETA